MHTEIDKLLTPKLIFECTPNSNFSANHPDNKNEYNYQANKYMFKVKKRKKFWCLYDKLLTYFVPCPSVFNVDFEHVIVHRVVFFHHEHQRFYVFCIENKFFKEWSLFKDFFPRFNSHFRLVQMTLKSITFEQSH